jgi:uncharacterized protein involved in exopolysaccharide biosynthesis
LIPQPNLPSAPSPSRPHPPDVDNADLFDYALIRHSVGFALRSVGRHKLVATLCFVLVLGLSAASLLIFPRTYQVQAIILALRNPVMSTLSNPNLFRPYEQDAPTRAARETVLRRDNLVSLINDTDLLKKEQRTRAPSYRVRDWILKHLKGHERTHDEQIDELVDLLEKQLTVDVSEGTVTISIEWTNAQTAYELVEAAMQNFLETRHTTEIAIVSDAISILESYGNSLQTQILSSTEQVNARERELRRKRPAPAKARPQAVRPRLASSPVPDQEYARLQAQLTAKRRAIFDLEEFRQRRLAELQTQLLQYQAIYAEGHPAVQSTRQNIEALSGPSPQLETLRSEAQEIEREIIRRAPPSGGDSAAMIAAATAAAHEDRADPAPAAADTGLDEADDPKLAQERSQLRMLVTNYSNVLERIGAARLELDAAQAAFKYRYSVVSPPQVPKRAVRPVPAKVIGGGFIGGLLLALFAATLLDVRSRRILERWQIERQVEVPVLAELRRWP